MGTSRSDKGNIDSVYYRDGVSASSAMSVLMKARMTIFDLFMREMQPDATSKVLDIGVSDDENEGANFLEKHYPWPHNITCAGLGDGEAVLRSYPKVEFRKIAPHEPLPFASNEFDIACSNAVLEHVGGPAQRADFIREHLRVGRSVFITVPNRWFPIEHHTKLPFLHYTPGLFRRLLSGGKLGYWAEPNNLDFLDRSTVLKEWPAASRSPKIVYTGIRLDRLSSNIAVIAKR
jgi:SAM-dependent methyltransferase